MIVDATRNLQHRSDLRELMKLGEIRTSNAACRSGASPGVVALQSGT